MNTTLTLPADVSPADYHDVQLMRECVQHVVTRTGQPHFRFVPPTRLADAAAVYEARPEIPVDYVVDRIVRAVRLLGQLGATHPDLTAQQPAGLLAQVTEWRADSGDPNPADAAARLVGLWCADQETARRVNAEQAAATKAKYTCPVCGGRKKASADKLCSDCTDVHEFLARAQRAAEIIDGTKMTRRQGVEKWMVTQ